MGNLVSSDVYTKQEINAGMKEITDDLVKRIDKIYTKQEVDDIIKNLNTAYTKQEVDDIIKKLYTKQEVDTKLNTAYTKQEVDTKFATAYTKQEVDTKFSDLKKEYVWCADGQLCKVPDASNGLSIGGYSIAKKDTKLCLKFGEKSYCFDGDTVSQS
jgi:hypothetical protein